MKTITKSQAAAIIATQGNRIFSVTFIKRSTGEPRIMRCRTGVKSELKGGDPAYDRQEHALLCVFDVEKHGYRSIPFEGLRELRAQGEQYKIR